MAGTITPRLLAAQELDDPAAREKFQPLIPGMLGSVVQIISAGDESSAQDALEMFIEVAEAHPRFLRKQLSEVVEVMLQVRTVLQQEGCSLCCFLLYVRAAPPA